MFPLGRKKEKQRFFHPVCNSFGSKRKPVGLEYGVASHASAILVCQKWWPTTKTRSNVPINFKPAHLPPGHTPGHLTFFIFGGQIPLPRAKKPVQLPHPRGKISSKSKASVTAKQRTTAPSCSWADEFLMEFIVFLRNVLELKLFLSFWEPKSVNYGSSMTPLGRKKFLADCA